MTTVVDFYRREDDVDSLEELTETDNARWSRSVGLWLVAGYFGLFIIRPWEVLAPWLADLRFERNYAIAMFVVVLVTGRRWMPTFQCWAVVILSTAIALSAVFAWNSALSWQPLYRYATVAVTYFLIVSVCRAPCDLYLLITGYIAVMWLYLSKSMWEYFIHGRHDYAQSVARLLGIDITFGDPNAVAMSATVSMPLWYFLWKRRNALTHGWGSMWQTVYLIGMATYPIISLTAVLFTFSRAGMIGFACFIVLARFRSAKRSSWIKSIFAGIIILAVLWFAMPTQQRDRLSTLWDPDAGPANAAASAAGRVDGFLAGWQMLQTFPATGVGLGNFLQYRISNVDGVSLIAHNLPGQILGELGLIGALAFLLSVFATIRNCRKIRAICLTSPEADCTLKNLNEIAGAITDTLLLLFLFGLSLHNGLRFNWIWIAAFAMVASQSARTRVQIRDSKP